MSIQHDHTLNPVTALAFYPVNDSILVFAGEGCFLKVFENLKLVAQCRVFDEQTIHGIVAQDDSSSVSGLQVAIWGGSSLILLSRRHLDSIINQGTTNIAGLENRTTDWILDVAISPYDQESCVLVTAHNTVLRATLQGVGNRASPAGYASVSTAKGSQDLSFNTEEHESMNIDTLGSPARSILYSAHLTWLLPHAILVAAGTVFGEIIVWRVDITMLKPSTHVIVTFSGHEGSVFGVSISPPITDSDGHEKRLLASCSDDRTIRIWDIYGKLANVEKGTALTELPVLPETCSEINGGLGQSINHCLAMAMGHVSRIWSVKWLVENNHTIQTCGINLLSFGEDATTQQWNLQLVNNTENEDGPRLNHLNTFAFHSGKHIWSQSIRQCSNKKITLATGGADGKVSLFEILTRGPTLGTRSSNDFTSTTSGAMTTPGLNFEDIIEANSCENYAPPVEQSVNNPVEGTSNAPKKKKKPKKIPKDSFNRYDFVSQTEFILTTIFGRVFLGNIDESVVWVEMFMPERMEKALESYSIVKGVREFGMAVLAGATGAVYLFSRESIFKIGQVSGKVADVLTCTGEKDIAVLVTTLDGNTATLFSLPTTPGESTNTSHTYQLPQKHIITSMWKGLNGQLVLGARNGALAFYSEIIPEPYLIKSPVSDDAVTSISLLSEDDQTQYFLTTGRNGRYLVWAFLASGENGVATCYIAHQGTPPLGPNIEGAWFSNDELFLYGFKSKSFVVWNETKQYEVMNVECGGAHRSYAYSRLESGGGHFVYTKASKFYVHTQLRPSHQIIKSGGHGREIKVTALSPDRKLIATGSEDTSIRTWRYQDSISTTRKSMECLSVVEQHTAGIQHLLWHGSNYFFSSGGNEEFFVWAVQEIPSFGVGVVCEASLAPVPAGDNDLRIMSFDVTSDGADSSEIIISLAYSDSTLRICRYSKCKGFSTVATGRYTSSCLTHLRHFVYKDDELIFLTAATDGKLVVWKVALHPDSLGRATIQSVHKVHQNSIKALDMTSTTVGNHVITGGDDGVLAVTYYCSPDFEIAPRSIILRAAHAAAITGLCILPGSSEGEMSVVSSSNDQRVKQWRIHLDSEGGMGISRMGDAFTSVADVGDVSALTSNKVLIAGNGMEAFMVNHQAQVT